MDDNYSDEEFCSLSTISSDDSYHSAVSPSLNDVISEHLSDDAKKFNVIHINAQSIPAHYPDMLASFTSNSIHAILVSETWLKPCLPSTSYSLPGFQLIRNDRTNRGGLGVAIYLKSNFPFSIISLSPQPPPIDAAEHILIEVELAHTKILLGVFYSPSLNVDYFTSFEQILVTHTPLY